MSYSLRARRAIRKNLTGNYEDRPITVDEVEMYGFNCERREYPDID